MPRPNASQNPRSTATDQARSPLAPLSRLAGPLALAAGILMIVVELVMLPIVDRDDRQGTSQNLTYRISGVVYFAAFCLLGFNALLPPWGVGLGLAMVWLGVWMLRTPAEVAA